ncbi:DUF86 domain-containing protein [Ammoniphilus sp. YIM 78166]|uniref:DUF86 domain-containing protein n=1 Tax=Ammoniphilus sp. YIM 78166 TaxID=1644106 RepID=UPI00106FEABC|nr:HepT-like ribonuclease domain-containing protein [Ammoniphilus sp. YIM 78166]
MYNVNTQKIDEILTYIDRSILPTLASVMGQSKDHFIQQPMATYAAERMFHLFIEGMTDVGNHLIDGFIMRDPGSYEDIVDIMEDERVYTSQQAAVFKEIILLRRDLVLHYTEPKHGKLYDVYSQHARVMEEYTSLIRQYLKKELW